MEGGTAYDLGEAREMTRVDEVRLQSHECDRRFVFVRVPFKDACLRLGSAFGSRDGALLLLQ